MTVIQMGIWWKSLAGSQFEYKSQESQWVRRNSMVEFSDFQKIDIRVGEIQRAEAFKKARKPAYKLWVDFGEEVGIKQSSAQITDCYEAEELVGQQVLAVVNFPPRQIADFISEVLVLGTYSDQGVVLIQPQQRVNNGDRLG